MTPVAWNQSDLAPGHCDLAPVHCGSGRLSQQGPAWEPRGQVRGEVVP